MFTIFFSLQTYEDKSANFYPLISKWFGSVVINVETSSKTEVLHATVIENAA